ncbi:hypothetical protein P5673_017956 [Acropora cervicornis]|uniref:Uncharacterized protein n=1 Tax=Acropora cervicornis TaxID=6130 RepID=A0AAD9V3G3_ACRCE|nr:hypothetical protein P5673_017956 [Acropora cervicornis]
MSHIHGNQIFCAKQRHLRQDGGAYSCFLAFLNPCQEAKITSNQTMWKALVQVKIYLDRNNVIKSSECKCPWGAYKRRHAAVLFIYEIHNLSRTDGECSWKEQNAPDISRKSIAEIFPPTKPGYTALLQQPNQGD